MKGIICLGFGAAFGFILHQSRVTDYDTILSLLRLQNFHAMGVLGVGIATTAVGFLVLRRARAASVLGGPVEFRPKAMHSGVLFGSLIFGIGWGLTGACPGTALAQIGEGKLYGLATVAGLLAGTLGYGLLRSRVPLVPRPKQVQAELQEL